MECLHLGCLSMECLSVEYLYFRRCLDELGHDCACVNQVPPVPKSSRWWENKLASSALTLHSFYSCSIFKLNFNMLVTGSILSQKYTKINMGNVTLWGKNMSRVLKISIYLNKSCPDNFELLRFWIMKWYEFRYVFNSTLFISYIGSLLD